MRKWSRLFVALTLGFVAGCQVNAKGVAVAPGKNDGGSVFYDGVAAEDGTVPVDGANAGDSQTMDSRGAAAEVLAADGALAGDGGPVVVDAIPRDGMNATGGTIAPDAAVVATGGAMIVDGAVKPDLGILPDGAVKTDSGVSTGGIVASGGVVATGGGATTGGVVATGGVVVATGGVVVDAQADLLVHLPDAGTPDTALPDSPLDTPRDTANLTLVWADEFEGNANTRADNTRWTYMTWEPGTVNNELQRYTSRIENAFHDGDGNLVIRALYTPMGTNRYTSARLETNGKFSFRTGRIEVRAKLPAGQGSFPGIVLMGETGSWPACGELALVEQWGEDKNWFYSTAYSPGNSGDAAHVKYTFPNDTTASEDFHVYSLDWQSDRLVFQVDGKLITSKTYDATSPFASIPEYIILDVAVGGNMGGDVDNDAFPMDMVVDYVRVYSY